MINHNNQKGASDGAQKTISVVVPVYNEAANIALIYKALSAVLSLSVPAQYEIIFVDDGSTDQSLKEIEAISLQDPAVSAVVFSRNFGKEIAISAGLKVAQGKAVIIIDADLQHPPELLPQFIEKWKQGNDIVIGLRTNASNRSPLKRMGAALFYFLINKLSNDTIKPGTTDFRLLDRKVVDQFNRFTERHRMTRGILDWVGFKRTYIPFTSPQRLYGKAGYSYGKLSTLAISALMSQTLLPLKIAAYIGGFITLFSGALGLFVIIEDIILKDPLGLVVSGTAMLAIMILFLVGIILSCLGFIGFYVATIYDEVINRPLYIVKQTINLGTYEQ